MHYLRSGSREGSFLGTKDASFDRKKLQICSPLTWRLVQRAICANRSERYLGEDTLTVNDIHCHYLLLHLSMRPVKRARNYHSDADSRGFTGKSHSSCKVPVAGINYDGVDITPKLRWHNGESTVNALLEEHHVALVPQKRE